MGYQRRVHGELSSLCGAIMNRFVVLAACVCASSAQQVLVGGIAGAYNPAPSTQFHAQDEFGQFSFGHAGGPLARTEARNAHGVTTGSYQYVDANGLLQTVNYVADPVNGFRVAGTNLPVGPAVPAAAPLEAPVFDLPVPVAVEDTPEVAAAKAEFQAAFDEAAAASAERRKREAEEVAVAAAPAILPAAAAVAHAPLVKSVVETPATVETEVAATPVISYAAAPAIAAPAIAAPVATPLAAAAPVAVAAAAPSRDAVLTQIKLNPGHATFYRVD